MLGIEYKKMKIIVIDLFIVFENLFTESIGVMRSNYTEMKCSETLTSDVHMNTKKRKNVNLDQSDHTYTRQSQESQDIPFESHDTMTLYQYIIRILDGSDSFTFKAPEKINWDQLEKMLGTKFKITHLIQCNHNCNDNCCFAVCHCDNHECVCKGSYFCGNDNLCDDSCEKDDYVTIEHNSDSHHIMQINRTLMKMFEE